MEEAAQLIKNIGLKNLDILYNLYHGNIVEADICEAMNTYFPYIKMIHCSDSERRIPGEGTINLPEIMQSLYKNRFQGIFSFEVERVVTEEETARQCCIT